MTVRAVHLELTNDLSTDWLKIVLRRFNSRRGHVLVTRLGSGTSYVVAASEVNDASKRIDRSKANYYYCEQEMQL